MMTKKVEYFVDLWPGWQDGQHSPCTMTLPPAFELTPGNRRIKIIVELPCFGGSADAEPFPIKAKVEEQR